jgi:DDE_Tnp_1-associated
MNYTTWREVIQEADVPMEVDALSVYRAFEQVEDGRHKRGMRYSVALILTLIVLAKLAGMTTPHAIAEWVRLRAGWLRKVLPMTRKNFPCAATYSNVLQALDAEQVNEVVTQLLTRVGAMKRCGDEPSRLVGQVERAQHVALDGKTLRGTLGHEAVDQRKMHQLALYETRTGLVLKEQVVGDKQNELSIVAQFLTPVWVKGRIIESRMPCTRNTRSAPTSLTAEATSYLHPQNLRLGVTIMYLLLTTLTSRLLNQIVHHPSESLQTPRSHIKVFFSDEDYLLYRLIQYLPTERNRQVDKDDDTVNYIQNLTFVEQNSYYKGMP